VRWYWWIPIAILVVIIKTTIYFTGEKIWAYLTTPQERAACESADYAAEVIIAGCTEMIEAGGYDDKTLAVVYYRRGHALTQRGRWAEALKDYSQALLLDPRYLAALNNRAYTLQALDRHKDALKDLDEALALAPDFPLALVNRAVSLRALGRNEDALKDVDRAIALGDTYARAFHQRGLILQQMNDASGAIAAFTRAIELNPRDANSYFALGQIYLEAKQYDKAAQEFSFAHDLAPNHQPTLFLRAQSYEYGGKREAAIADYRRLLAMSPGNYQAQMGLARLGVTDGKSDEQFCHGPYNRDERVRACTRAIESGRLAPENKVKALLARAQLHLYHPNGLAPAADDVDSAAEIAPNDLRVIELRGTIALQLKSYNRALTSFDAMLKVAPDHASARLGRAQALLGLKRYREALPEFDAAIKRQPDRSIYYLYRAQAHEGLGQRDAAIKDYRVAYRGSPNLTEAREGLARLGQEP